MSATQTRVPAWKRLGLRLKYAKETADESITSPQNGSATISDSNGQAQHMNGSTENLRPPKKRKLSPPENGDFDMNETTKGNGESQTGPATLAREHHVVPSTEARGSTNEATSFSNEG